MKEVAMKSAPVPESPAQELPRIVVVVQGGVVNAVMCDIPVKVAVLDYDEIECSTLEELDASSFFCFGDADGDAVDSEIEAALEYAEKHCADPDLDEE